MRLPVVAITLLLVASPSLAGWDEGVAAFKTKNYQQAAQEFQKVIEQSPDGYRGYYMLGLCLEQLKRKEEALHNLRKAYDLNPSDTAIKLALGRSYNSLRRYADSAKLLTTVDPSSLEAAQKLAFYQMRGEANHNSGNNDAAINDFRELANLRPQDAQAQYNYAAAAMNAGRLDDALNALAKAVQLAPGDADKKETYVNALIKKGRMTSSKDAKVGHYKKAAGLAKELATAKPTYDNLMLQCSAELGAGLYTEAAGTGKAAITKQGTDWLAHFYVGQAYSSVPQYDAAEGPLKQALQLAKDPKDQQQVLKQLGYIYEKQKKWTESIEAYNKAGDSAAVNRVKENKDTAAFNEQASKEEEAIKKAQEEARKLEEELQKLKKGGGSGRQ